VVDLGAARLYPAYVHEHSPDYGNHRGKSRARVWPTGVDHVRLISGSNTWTHRDLNPIRSEAGRQWV
jgi:hypothetical protein